MLNIATENKKNFNEYIMINNKNTNKTTKPETTTKTPANYNNSNRNSKNFEIVSENHCPNTVRP